MTTPLPAASPPPASGSGRRVGALAILGLVVFVVLWAFFAVTATTAFFIGVGVGGVLYGASLVSDVLETLIDLVASAILGVFAVIGAIFAALFSLWS